MSDRALVVDAVVASVAYSKSIPAPFSFIALMCIDWQQLTAS